MPGKTDVAVLDQRRLVREGVCALLTEAGYFVAGSYSSFEACAAELDKLGAATLIVVGQLSDATSSTSKSVHRLRAVPLGDRLVDLIAAIDAVSPTKQAGFPSSQTSMQRTPQYSTREQQILDFLAQGLSADQMARALGISRSTIEHHKQQLFARVGVQSQAHAVAVSRQSPRLTPATSGA